MRFAVTAAAAALIFAAAADAQPIRVGFEAPFNGPRVRNCRSGEVLGNGDLVVTNGVATMTGLVLAVVLIDCHQGGFGVISVPAPEAFAVGPISAQGHESFSGELTLHGSGINVSSLVMQGRISASYAEGSFSIDIPGLGGPLAGRFDSRRYICTPYGCN